MPSDLFGIPLHEHCETTQYVLEVGVKLWLNYPFSFFFFWMLLQLELQNHTSYLID